MLSKLIGISFLAYCVTAADSFIGDVKRAELFELTDNEVAVFRINIPDEEFFQLKETAKKGYGGFGGWGGDSNFDFSAFNNTDGGWDFGNWGGNTNNTGGAFGNWGGFSNMDGNTDTSVDTDNANNNGGGFAGWGGFGNTDDSNNTGGGFGGWDDFSFGAFDVFSNKEEFKTKNATMVVELAGKKNAFKKITFSLGGSSSRGFSKQGYNIKIRGKNDLFGRTQIRLRPDAREATYLRSKLVCDMLNRLGLPSISANYATLYINDEFMGFYVLMDSIKVSWIEYLFDDPNTTTLYQCNSVNNNLSLKVSGTGCENLNDEVTDNSEWLEFLGRLDEAQSAEDIEDIFDIDLFLYEMAFEYLSGSWDHFLSFGHNFYLYKPKNDKWKFLLYDFDGDLGQDIVIYNFGQTNTNNDYTKYSFAEWTKSIHLIDILILNDSTRFDNILKKFVTEVFNPATLFPRIDELKEFIKPYIILDKTPNEEGLYPGRINGNEDYSLAEWDVNSEFTSIKSSSEHKAYGLKYWILEKYRYVCKAYDMECDEEYLDDNYEYTIDTELEVKDEDLKTISWANWDNWDQVVSQQVPNETVLPSQPTETVVSEPTETVVNEPTETTIPEQQFLCWAAIIGYPCCSPGNTKVYLQDENGDWGYDFIKKEWCGISPYEEKTNDEECWSEIFGYPCCKDCVVYETDEYGKWGYDFANKQWCGIQSYCPV